MFTDLVSSRTESKRTKTQKTVLPNTEMQAGKTNIQSTERTLWLTEIDRIRDKPFLDGWKETWSTVTRMY